jgi:hypothetical protein
MIAEHPVPYVLELSTFLMDDKFKRLSLSSYYILLIYNLNFGFS